MSVRANSICHVPSTISGLAIALGIMGPIKKKYPEVSYADAFQMASAVAVEVSTACI